MSHYIERCRHGRVVNQCRCAGPKEERIVECLPSCQDAKAAALSPEMIKKIIAEQAEQSAWCYLRQAPLHEAARVSREYWLQRELPPWVMLRPQAPQDEHVIMAALLAHQDELYEQYAQLRADNVPERSMMIIAPYREVGVMLSDVWFNGLPVRVEYGATEFRVLRVV